jgi:hypothetical protein
MTLQPLLGPGLFFSFVIFFTQTVGLLGRAISPSQFRYLHTEQHKHRINAHRHPCLQWDSSPRSHRSSERRQFTPQTARPLWSVDSIDFQYKISLKLFSSFRDDTCRRTAKTYAFTVCTMCKERWFINHQPAHENSHVSKRPRHATLRNSIRVHRIFECNAVLICVISLYNLNTCYVTTKRITAGVAVSNSRSCNFPRHR